MSSPFSSFAATERQEKIDNTQEVPLDEFTRALLNLGFQRDLFGERKAKQERVKA